MFSTTKQGSFSGDKHNSRSRNTKQKLGGNAHTSNIVVKPFDNSFTTTTTGMGPIAGTSGAQMGSTVGGVFDMQQFRTTMSISAQ